MRRKIILYIYFNLLIFNIWIYISNKIFDKTYNNLRKTLFIFTVGVLSAGGLFLINNYKNIISIESLQNINYIYILTLLFIPLLHFIIVKVKFNYIYKFIIHFLIIVIILIVIKMSDMSDGIIYYYLLVGIIEEFIKFNLGNNLFLSNGKIKSDILLFGIISGIGFGFIENMIYVYNFLVGNNEINFGLFLVTRGIFGFLIHIIFSGILTYGMYLYYKNESDNITNIYHKYIKYAFYFLGFFTLSAGLHSIYNIFIGKYTAWGGMIIIILGYLGVSYLFFLSDRRYYEQNSK